MVRMAMVFETVRKVQAACAGFIRDKGLGIAQTMQPPSVSHWETVRIHQFWMAK